ncbi:MAG: molecular chaperone HtpG, partial [Prolixibacteraceae bacterium]
KVLDEKETSLGQELPKFREQLSALKQEKETAEKAKEGKKEEEVSQDEKEKLEDLDKKIAAVEEEKRKKLESFGKGNKLARQLVDLALLANGMLKGEDLDKFVRRSVELIK